MEIRWAEIDWFIECFGMSDATTWSFQADDRWNIIRGTPGPTMGVFPLGAGRRAAFDDVLFLANCLAFDHDLPVMVRPARATPAMQAPLVPPVIPEAGPDPGQWYWSALGEAIGMVAELRLGAGTVVLRYNEPDHPLTRFTERFGSRQEPLALYAMAARQADPLTEYLCLYRVIEWAGRGNAERYAREHLADLGTYDFGECFVLDIKRDEASLFEIWRGRALQRLAAIDRSADKVAEWLTQTRNAIAHGSVRTRQHDFGASMAEVGADLPIAKLLARIAVESG